MEDRFNFRIWKKRENQMVNNITNLNPLLLDKSLNKDADNYVIMQCTGLKDKNGNLIYEGDIITRVDSMPQTYYIHWDKKGFWCASTHSLAMCVNSIEEHYIIISNIYKEPDLIY